jgi:hypothetical protein
VLSEPRPTSWAAGADHYERKSHSLLSRWLQQWRVWLVATIVERGGAVHKHLLTLRGRPHTSCVLDCPSVSTILTVCNTTSGAQHRATEERSTLCSPKVPLFPSFSHRIRIFFAACIRSGMPTTPACVAMCALRGRHCCIARTSLCWYVHHIVDSHQLFASRSRCDHATPGSLLHQQAWREAAGQQGKLPACSLPQAVSPSIVGFPYAEAAVCCHVPQFPK